MYNVLKAGKDYASEKLQIKSKMGNELCADFMLIAAFSIYNVSYTFQLLPLVTVTKKKKVVNKEIQTFL